MGWGEALSFVASLNGLIVVSTKFLCCEISQLAIVQIHKDAETNTLIQIHQYKYTNTNTQIYKYNTSLNGLIVDSTKFFAFLAIVQFSQWLPSPSEIHSSKQTSLFASSSSWKVKSLRLNIVLNSHKELQMIPAPL